ncbi:MAG: DNA polymerase III subunit delta [Oscillospiraceae bacterium]|nr:DNA polymerase III subunit delta [Oscillospiraceae bacterium]
MANCSASDLLHAVGSEQPPQLCFLCGEDTLAVAQLEKKILKKLTDGGEMSDAILDGQGVDLDRLADACSFSPMFQPYNVILIRDFDPDMHSAVVIERMLKIFEDLAPRVMVLISMRSIPVYEVKRGAPVILQKFKKLTAFFEKQGALCLCEKKNAIQLGKQIQDRVKRHGSEIRRDLAEALANRCLCDTTLIQSELDKLLACADGGEITAEMLDALVAKLPDADAFRLARAVTGGNGNAAFQLLNDLTAKSEDSKTILGLLSVLSSAFIDLYRAKLGQGAAKQQQTIAEEFHYPRNREFAIRNAMKDCTSVTLPKLRSCIRILCEADRACKSSRTAPRLLLEQAIVRMLCVRRDGSEAIR